jgi:hypothetical protein
MSATEYPEGREHIGDVKNQRLNTKAPQQIYKNNMQNLLYYYQTLRGRATPYNGSYYGRDPLLFTCLFEGASSY